MCSGILFGVDSCFRKVAEFHPIMKSVLLTKVGNLVPKKKKVTVSQLQRPRRCKRVQSALPLGKKRSRRLIIGLILESAFGQLAAASLPSTASFVNHAVTGRAYVHLFMLSSKILSLGERKKFTLAR